MKRIEMIELMELLFYREGIDKTWNLTIPEFVDELLCLIEEAGMVFQIPEESRILGENTCFECGAGKLGWEEEWKLKRQY